MATLIGLLLSNFGAIPSNAPQYGVVNKFLLPLAVPLLLLTADLRCVAVALDGLQDQREARHLQGQLWNLHTLFLPARTSDMS